MGCLSCGAESRPGARFCNECGAALANRCASCGQDNPPGSRFCDACGQPLTTPARPDSSAAGAPPTSPRSFTPRHLAEKILAGRDALAGERKQVTVLFADVVGSTELIRDRDPEDAQRLLDGAIRRMMAAVHRYEGTVSRLMGDGLMAMFGAPVAHEDHAVRACYAALAMLEEVHTYAAEVLAVHGAEIQSRVGLNSGEVVVRLISDDLHMDYTAMGQTVHLAARMESLASAGTIALSPATLALAEGFVEVRPLGPTEVKGIGQLVEVYELIGASAARTRLQASAGRGFTRFVGRQRELETILAAMDRTRAGHGRVVALIGEPGVGKSRLVREATASARAAGWRVLETGAVSYGLSLPYLPVADLLRTSFGIGARDDPEAARRRVAEGLLALDSTLEPDLTAVLALLDLGTDDPAWLALDPPRRRRRTLDAVRRLLLRESRERPLLLVFEDLHWVDSETQSLLDSLVEGLPAAPVLLLVNYRPEYEHRWGSKTAYTQLRLDPLAEESAEALLRSLLGDHAALDRLKHHLVERTGGNPLFLEESVSTLVGTGVLIGERGAYRLARAPSTIEVPATVQAVLAARIDRLPPEEKRLLQSAAVIGKDVPLALLEAIADLPDEALRRGLSDLQAAEFLYEAGAFPELAYTFKHALTHEVAYGGLLRERRRDLHARIVGTVETLYRDRLGEQVERLAYHSVRGEAWEKAAVYLHQTGLRAHARSANREAVASFEQGLAALARLPESREWLERELDLCLDLRNSLWLLDDQGRIVEYLGRARRAAERLEDPIALARVLALTCNQLTIVGDLGRAAEAGEQAVRLSTGVAPDVERLACFQLATTLRCRGELRRALGLNRRVIESLRDDQPPGRFSNVLPAAVARVWAAWIEADLGAFDEARRLGAEAVRIAEEGDHAFSVTLAYFGTGYAALRRGDCERAIPALERSFDLCRAGHAPNFRSAIVACLGAGYGLAGRAADARRVLSGWEGFAQTTDLALWVCLVGEATLLSGGAQAARPFAEHGLAFARARGERRNEAWALRLLGEVTIDHPDGELAERYYREALVLAEELDLRPLQAHCRLGLGVLYRRAGRLDDARAHLSGAIDLLRDMRMLRWLPRAEAELTQAGGLTPGDYAG